MPLNRTVTSSVATTVGSALLLAVTGCSVGPNYSPPEVDVPIAFGENVATTQPATQPSSLGAWWEVFNDPQLTRLIDRAIAGNNDLKIAAARVQEGRALYVGSKSGLFPSFDGVAGYRHDRRGDNEDGNSSGDDSGNNFFSNDPDRHNWSAGFDASWEIDIFGGVRRSIEASDADFGALIEDQRDVLITLVSDVARNYIILRGAQRQLVIVQKNLQTQDQTLELTRSRFRAGLTSDLDVARAESQAMTTRSQIPPFEDQVRQAVRRISVLCGSNPETLLEELSPIAEIPQAAPIVPAGLPSELLRRRPDIRRAERNVAAETARVGVAVADLFPRFSITGDFGYTSRNVKSLFDEDSFGWGIGPAMRWQLLNFGRVQGNIKAQEARREQTLRFYDQTVLLSLEEVENAMGSYRREQERRQSLAAAVSSSQRSVELADQLYRQGLTAFQDVLDAQRTLLDVESQFVTSDQTVSTNLVALFKALGGGWDPNGPPVDKGPVIYLP